MDDVLVDYLRYMLKQVQVYFEPKYADGKKLWETLSPGMVVILSTPNGWEGAQQNRMRTAAIKAGVVDQNGGARVKFVQVSFLFKVFVHWTLGCIHLCCRLRKN